MSDIWNMTYLTDYWDRKIVVTILNKSLGQYNSKYSLYVPFSDCFTWYIYEYVIWHMKYDIFIRLLTWDLLKTYLILWVMTIPKMYDMYHFVAASLDISMNMSYDIWNMTYLVIIDKGQFGNLYRITSWVMTIPKMYDMYHSVTASFDISMNMSYDI